MLWQEEPRGLEPWKHDDGYDDHDDDDDDGNDDDVDNKLNLVF